jgi:phage terminase small subunit
VLKDELNERQKRFVLEYLKDFNGSAAYQRAGYSAKGTVADVGASKLLRQAKVRKALARAREELLQHLVVDKQYIMDHLRRNLERAMQEVEVVDKKGNPTGVFQYEGAVANKVLELMGKELGMFKGNVEVNHAEPITTIEIIRTVREGVDGEEEVVEVAHEPIYELGEGDAD